MEGYELGKGMGRMGEKEQGINDRHKINMGILRTVQEMEKPKNLYARPMDLN